MNRITDEEIIEKLARRKMESLGWNWDKQSSRAKLPYIEEVTIIFNFLKSEHLLASCEKQVKDMAGDETKLRETIYFKIHSHCEIGMLCERLHFKDAISCATCETIQEEMMGKILNLVHQHFAAKLAEQAAEIERLKVEDKPIYTCENGRKIYEI